MIARPKPFTPHAAARRRRYHRLGQLSELVAAALLMAKGYRILARRLKMPSGEIDLVARRGRRVVFVEVKRRASWEESLSAVTPHQRARIRRAADLWLARHPCYQDYELRFDVVFLVPGRWPVHIENGL